MEADIHHVEAEGGALAQVVVYSENRNTVKCHVQYRIYCSYPVIVWD